MRGSISSFLKILKRGRPYFPVPKKANDFAHKRAWAEKRVIGLIEL